MFIPRFLILKRAREIKAQERRLVALRNLLHYYVRVREGLGDYARSHSNCINCLLFWWDMYREALHQGKEGTKSPEKKGLDRWEL